jgi:hypothetical protein
MMKTTVGELQPRDEFRTGEKGPRYTVESISTERGDSYVRNVYAERRDRPVLVTTVETTVWAVRMVREIEVPCHALSHGTKLVGLLHDLAAGPQPRSIFCGECAAAVDEQQAIEP